MKALVLGKGKSGDAAAKVLKASGWDVDFADGYQLVVASPGVPVKSELQLGCEELKRRGWKLIAITGSKGKSSVVKLVASALGGVACGNYGLPVSALIGERPSWAVVEVSSFMMETTNLPPDFFEAAAILNFQADHLDRHGSVELYHALKRRLLSFAKCVVTESLICPQPIKLWRETYFDNAILGANAAIATALLKSVGVSETAIRRAFTEFLPLPHRFETIAEFNGVRYVDDSKATSIEAMIAGVKMCENKGNVRLIAGGLAKGDDPKTALGVLTKMVKKVYLIGRCAKVFEAAWSSVVECELLETMENAVRAVMREAKKGDVVLLSPGTASFDQFKNFEERGESFANFVNKEYKKYE